MYANACSTISLYGDVADPVRIDPDERVEDFKGKGLYSRDTLVGKLADETDVTGKFVYVSKAPCGSIQRVNFSNSTHP